MNIAVPLKECKRRIVFLRFAAGICLFVQVGRMYAQQTVKPFEEQYPALIRKVEFRTFTVKDGLTANHFRGRLLVDSRGYIWAGTFDGLNRFDGYKFENFRNNPLDSNSLSDNGVRAICEDHRGAIWLGTRMLGGKIGLHHYDSNTKTVYRHTNELLDSTVSGSDVVNCIYEDHRNTLWVGTTNGLYGVRYQPNSHPTNGIGKQQLTYVKYSHDPGNPVSLSNDSVLSIREDAEHALWIRTTKGVDRLDTRTRSIVRFREDPRVPHSLVGKLINEVYEDRSGLLWICTDKGLYMVQKNSGSLTHFKNDASDDRSLSNDLVYTVHQDRGGTIWVGTFRGLNELDPVTRKFVRHLMGPGAIVISIAEDRAGNLWVGTNGKGLSQLTKRARELKTYTLAGHESSRLHLAREASNGGLWTNPGDGDSIIYVDSTRRTKAWRLDVPDFGMMLPGRQGGLWLATRGKGLVLRDKAGTIFFYQFNPVGEPIWKNDLGFIYQDSQGYLWVVLKPNNGLIRFDPNSRTIVRHYRHDPSNPTSISTSGVNSLIEDDEHFFWIATDNGLNRLEPLTDKFTHWTHNPTDTTTLSSSIIQGLAEGYDGSLWVGTSLGVNRFDKKTGKVQRFFRGDGHLSNYTFQILKDGTGNLWVGYSNNGFSKLDVRTGRFTTFTERDGLRNEMFNTYDCMQRQNGEMIFQSSGRSVVFHPDSLRPSTFMPPIVLTAFSVFDRSVTLSEDSVSYKSITMPYDSNFFAFEFISLDLTVPERNQHAYMLEGYEDNWNYVGNKREAKYTKVPPGEYVFRVKGTNSDGVWNEMGTFINITITPPWWKTTWAYLGYGAAILGVLYTIRRSEKHRDRLKHQAELEHARAESLQEVDSLKSRFFANISHEFRTPLTLMEGPAKQLLEGEYTGDPKSLYKIIVRNSHRLLKLVNQLLDLSKLDAGKMNLVLKELDIVELIREVASSFDSLAQRKGVALSIVADQEAIVGQFDQEKIEQIIINLLSNALKFTEEGGSVTVSITRHPERSESRRFLSGRTESKDVPRDGSSEHASPDRERRDRLESIGTALSMTRDGFVTIKVTDTGVGIPADQLDKVFDRFYQVDASQTREQEGTGIGLALTKELVKVQQGTITVNSEVGKGSEFIVTLPLGKPAEAPSPTSQLRTPTAQRPTAATVVEENEPSEISAAMKQGAIILIIEDNADMRAYIRSYLAATYIVHEAKDGVDGIEKAKEVIPDLIICDVMMPRMDGFEVAKILKAEEKTSHIPIVMLTAKAGQESKLEGLEKGADDYITKPFDAKELLIRSRNLIEGRRKLRERFSAARVLKPGEIEVQSLDDAFLQKVKTAVEARMSDEEFSVEDLAKEVSMSRSQLHRKLTAVTNQSPSDFIRYMRLHRAKELLEKNAGSVSEIAFMVGFNTVAYFSKCFHDQFGVVPSEARSKK